MSKQQRRGIGDIGIMGIVTIIMTFVFVGLMSILSAADAAPKNPADKAVTVGGGRSTYPIFNEEYKGATDATGSMGGESPYCLPSMMFLVNRLGESESGASIVVLNKRSQFTTMSGDTSGASVYWGQAGIHYIVDLHAIALSDGNGTGTTSITTFTGVTIFQPQSNAQNKHKTFTVEYGITGTTGYAASVTGTSTVFVFPFPGNTGLTVFGKSSETYATAYRNSNTPYVLARNYSVNGTTTEDITYGSGASDWEINKVGERKTWRLSDAGSQVSAWVIDKRVQN